MKPTLAHQTLLSIAAGLLALPALAKLPPPSDDAKAKAAEAAAKAAHGGKVEAYLLCKAQDRAAAQYRKTHKDAPKAAAAAACADPGPFVYTPPAAAALVAPAAPAPAAPAAAPTPQKKS